MSWNSIINQQRVKRLLRNALEKGQLAHALLFTGPEGTGMEGAALELAKILNCEQQWAGPTAHTKITDACEECNNCVKAAALQHPNIHLIFPLPVGKGEDAGDGPLEKLTRPEVELVQAEIAAKAADPYHAIAIPRASIIKVNSIREIRRTSTLSTFSRGKRVYVIFDAEKMNPEAANALLKTLEEPLPDTIIILTTTSPDELLPTVISRCQRLRFDLLPEHEIRQGLVERKGMAPERAATVAALARGSYRQALDLADVNIDEYRDDLVEMLRTFLYRSREEVFAAIDTLASGKDRQEVLRVLSLMQAWFHEAMALQNGAGELASFQDDTLRKFTEAYGRIDYAGVASALDEAISLLGKNVYIPLLLTVLALNIRKFVLSSTRSGS